MEEVLKGLERGVGDSILSSGDVDNVTGELGDIGKMALLSGGPGQRGEEKGVHQGLVVGEKGEFKTLQEETEVTNGGIGCQKLSVEGRVFGFVRRTFLGEKGKWGPGPRRRCWRTAPMCESEASTAREIGALGSE